MGHQCFACHSRRGRGRIEACSRNRSRPPRRGKRPFQNHRNARAARLHPAWDLGQGETAVLSYALAHRKWVAVLDDGAARRCARSLAVNMTGTLAVVLLAKQYGLIDSAAQVLQDLRGAGFRLDDAVIRDALARTVGETWKSGT